MAESLCRELYDNVRIINYNPQKVVLALRCENNSVGKYEEISYSVTNRYPAAKFNTPWFIYQSDSWIFIGIHIDRICVTFDHHVDICIDAERLIHISLLKILSAEPNMLARPESENKDTLQNVLSKMLEPKNKQPIAVDDGPITGVLYPIHTTTCFRLCYPDKQKVNVPISIQRLDMKYVSDTSNAALRFHLRCMELAVWGLYKNALKTLQLGFIEGLDTSDVQQCFSDITSDILSHFITSGGPPIFLACMGTAPLIYKKYNDIFPYCPVHKLIDQVRSAGSLTAFYSSTDKFTTSMFYSVRPGIFSDAGTRLSFYDLNTNEPKGRLNDIEIDITEILTNSIEHATVLGSFIGYCSNL